jgi:hypothetical protein
MYFGSRHGATKALRFFAKEGDRCASLRRSGYQKNRKAKPDNSDSAFPFSITDNLLRENTQSQIIATNFIQCS